MNLTEKEVKDIFFSLKNDNPNGVFFGEHPNEIDLQEFANRVGEYVGKQEYMRGKKDAHKRCIELTSDINPKVASYLLDKREYSE